MRISDWSSDVCSSDLRLDDQVVVRQQQRQVGIAFRQADHEVAAVGLHVADRVHDAEGAGLGVLVAVALQGRDHVVDGQFLAVVELHALRSEEHTSELQSLMRISYAVFCLKKKTIKAY